MTEITFKFKEGGMWEELGFEIIKDYPMSGYFEPSEYDVKPCRHCHSISEVTRERIDKSTYKERTWVCPYVIVAYNEGHCNSTGVCAECIVEAFGKVKGEIT